MTTHKRYILPIYESVMDRNEIVKSSELINNMISGFKKFCLTCEYI